MLNCASKQKMVAIASVVILCMGGLSACGKMQTADELLKEAIQYQQKGDNRAAIIQLKNAIQREPDDIEIRHRLGLIYNDMDEPQSAEKELRKAMSLGMSPANVYPDLGRAMIMQGQYKKILEETQSILGTGFDPAILVLRANSYLALGQSSKAKEIFELVLEDKPDNPGALIGLAKHALMEGDDKSAFRLAKQATGKNPDNIDAWFFKGSLLTSQGKIEPAHIAYDQVLKIKPDNIAANIAKAYLYINEKKFDAAKASIEAARKSDPAHIIVFYAQALLDFAQGNYSSSWDSLQQVLHVAPGHMPSLLLAGAVQFALGSMPQAEQHLRRYVERNPGNLYARKLLASTLLKSGQAQRALIVLEPALKDGQHDAQLLSLAGESRMQTRDFAKAGEYFEKASLFAPETAQIRTSLAMSKLALGDHSSAISELEKALSLDAKSTQAGLLLVMTQLRLKKYDKALIAVQALEKEQGENPLIQNLKGSAYMGLMDVASSRASFQRALFLQPAYFPAAENLAQIDMQEKKPELAKKRFMDILEHDKKNIQAMTALARLAQSQGNTTEATKWLETANRENPDALLPAMQLAANYLRAEENNKALTLLQNLQVSNPNNTDLLLLLSQAQLANSMQSAALITLHRLSIMMPDSALIQLHISNAHVSMGDLPAAAEDIRKSLALQPDFLDAQMAQASLDIRKSDYAGALLVARKIQNKHENSPLGFAMEGDVLMAQRKPMPAAASYEHAFSLNKNGSLLAKLHGALKKAGKGKEADSRLILWLNEHPSDQSTRMYLADAYLAEKKYEDAIAQFQILLQQNPNNSAVLNNLAWVYHQQKDTRALEYAEKAYQHSANGPAVLDTLGWILAEQGNLARGLPLLQKAVSLAPEATDIRFHLAQSLIKAGDKQGARKELEQLLAGNKASSDNDAIKSLLKRL